MISKNLLAIIVTYNHEETIQRAIKSLLAQKTKHNFKLIVVDNNSKDNTVRIMKELQASGFDFEIIINPENSGFTGGNNMIFEKYLATTDYFYLHNSDAYYDDENALDKLVDLAQSKEGNSLLQPFITDPKTDIHSYGNELFYLGFSYMSKKAKENQKVTTSVGAVSGASMLISSKILDKVGLFDNKYFAYLEDSEFTARVRLGGFDCEVANNVEVFHEHEFARYGAFKLFLIERNRFYFLSAFYSPLSLLFLTPVILMTLITNAAFITVKVGFKTVINVYKDLLTNGINYSATRANLERFTTRESMINLYSYFSGKMDSYEKVGIVPLAISITNFITSGYFLLFRVVHKFIISKVSY